MIDFVRSYKVCGMCGDHFQFCQCDGLGSCLMILHPAQLPVPPADMSPADQLYRWHILYQATGAMACGLHPAGMRLDKYMGAFVYFTTKNRDLLIAAAHTYVNSWSHPDCWQNVTAELAKTERSFQPSSNELKVLLSHISVATDYDLKAYIVNAAELFGNSKWFYMSSAHIAFVRVILTRARNIPLSERKIMAGVAIGLWHTHLTLFDGAPWLCLDNSQHRLHCLYG